MLIRDTVCTRGGRCWFEIQCVPGLGDVDSRYSVYQGWAMLVRDTVCTRGGRCWFEIQCVPGVGDVDLRYSVYQGWAMLVLTLVPSLYFSA
jgi:hypothetical protein